MTTSERSGGNITQAWQSSAWIIAIEGTAAQGQATLTNLNLMITSHTQ